MSDGKSAKGEGKRAKDGEPIVIKKYANRRLYNTQSSSYITLDHLAKMIREEVEFKVIDAKAGDDITHTILTQIIMEEEATGEQMLPTSFLRQLISLYGNSMQAMVPKFLENSMDQFRANQAKLRKSLEDSPIGRMTERNVDMLKSAASVLRGSKSKGEGKGGAKSEKASEESVEPASEKDEIAALRAQMAEMQRKLDALGK